MGLCPRRHETRERKRRRHLGKHSGRVRLPFGGCARNAASMTRMHKDDIVPAALLIGGLVIVWGATLYAALAILL